MDTLVKKEVESNPFALLLKKFIANPQDLSPEELGELADYGDFKKFMKYTPALCYRGPANFLEYLSGYGDINHLKYFSENLPDQFQTMATSGNELAFDLAAESGRTLVMEFLLEKNQGIGVNYRSAFFYACEKGHVSPLNLIAKKISTKALQNLISCKDNGIVRSVCENGHLSVLQFLLENAATQYKEKMLIEYDFLLFQEAAYHGHLSVVKFILEKIPSNLHQKMLVSDNYLAFLRSSIMGHVEVLVYLTNILDSSNRQDMLIHKQYSIFNMFIGHDISNTSLSLNFLLNMLDERNLRKMLSELTGSSSFINAINNNRYQSAMIYDLLTRDSEIAIRNTMHLIMGMAGFSILFIPAEIILVPLHYAQYLIKKEFHRTNNPERSFSREEAEMARWRLQSCSDSLQNAEKIEDKTKQSLQTVAAIEGLEETLVIEDTLIPAYSALVKNTLFIDKIRLQFKPETNEEEQPVLSQTSASSTLKLGL